MGKVRAVDPAEAEAKLKEKQAKEAERLARIEAAKAKGQQRKDLEEQQPTTSVILNDSEGSHAKPQSDNSEKKEPKTSKYAEKVAVRKVGTKKAIRSANYLSKAKLIEKNKQYAVKEALALVEKTHLAKFDETIELHINTLTTGVSGHVILPHGTGKQTKVAILAPNKDLKAAEELLAAIEAGKLNFDILIATPDAMPKLAKVARILGPKGLMPNPKNGTVTTNPDAVAAQYAGGQMNFKTEAKTPIIHLAVGKLSFGPEKLSENITVALAAVKSANIKSVVVKSTMSPSVKLLVK